MVDVTHNIITVMPVNYELNYYHANSGTTSNFYGILVRLDLKREKKVAFQ